MSDLTYCLKFKKKKKKKRSEANILKKKKKSGSQTKQDRYRIVQEIFSKTIGSETRTDKTY